MWFSNFSFPQLSVPVGGPGLPVLLPGESYSCHLADREGRYNVTVPAIAVVEGSNYTCNITGSNFNYMGVASGIFNLPLVP